MESLVRMAAFWICFIEFVVLIVYYCPLIAQVPLAWLISDPGVVDVHFFDDNYVSDLLFTNNVYKTLMTSLVGLQLCSCAFFVVQLNQASLSYFPLMVSELFCLILAWIGWVVLSTIYQDADGKIIPGHIIGAGMFIFGCGVYFGLMVGNVTTIRTGQWTRMDYAVFIGVIVLFTSSLVNGSLFIASYFGDRIVCGWMYEHAAFILFTGANILLFLIDGMLESNKHELKQSPGALDIRIQKPDIKLFKQSSPQRIQEQKL